MTPALDRPRRSRRPRRALRSFAALLAAALALAAPHAAAAPRAKAAKRPAAPRVQPIDPDKLAPQPLENAAALAPFFAALERLEAETAAGAPRSVVRVLHFGDSHVAADYWTGEMRTLLQRRFGDAGTGYVMPGKPWRFFRHARAKTLGAGWETIGLGKTPCDGLLGLSQTAVRPAKRRGWAGASSEGAFFEVQAASDGGRGCLSLFVDDKLLFSGPIGGGTSFVDPAGAVAVPLPEEAADKAPDAAPRAADAAADAPRPNTIAPPDDAPPAPEAPRLNTIAPPTAEGATPAPLAAAHAINAEAPDGAEAATTAAGAPANGAAVGGSDDEAAAALGVAFLRNRAPLADGPHKIALAADCGEPARLLGIDFRSGRGGVLYDTLGINGASIHFLDHWRSDVRALLLRHADPKLIVVSYGTNDMGDKDFVFADYRALVVRLLGAIRRDVPGAAVLVAGPIDRGAARRRAFGFKPENQELVVRALREAALETGCAFWDARAAVGGPGAAERWAAAKLAQSDHVHLTEAGYAKLAEMLARAVFAAYDAHRGPAPVSEGVRGEAAPATIE